MAHPVREYWCIFENNFQNLFNNNFFKEFVELAGLLRVLLDIHDIKIPNELYGISTAVGTLEKDSKTIIDLTFREACNKIIHAKQVKISFDITNQHPLASEKNGYNQTETNTFKKPMVITEGDFQGKGWEAKIDFFKYIDQAVNLPRE